MATQFRLSQSLLLLLHVAYIGNNYTGVNTAFRLANEPPGKTRGQLAPMYGSTSAHLAGIACQAAGRDARTSGDG